MVIKASKISRFNLTLLIGVFLVSLPQGIRSARNASNLSLNGNFPWTLDDMDHMTAEVAAHGMQEETQEGDIDLLLDEKRNNSVQAVVDATDHHSHTVAVSDANSQRSLPVARPHFHKSERPNPRNTLGSMGGNRVVKGLVKQGEASATTNFTNTKSSLIATSKQHQFARARGRHGMDGNWKWNLSLGVESEVDPHNKYPRLSLFSPSSIIHNVMYSELRDTQMIVTSVLLFIILVLSGCIVFLYNAQKKQTETPRNDVPEFTPEPSIGGTVNLYDPGLASSRGPDLIPVVPVEPVATIDKSAQSSSSDIGTKTDPLSTAVKVKKEPQMLAWLTADECVAMGLPPLGQTMQEYLQKPPWVWQTVNSWVRMPFPWDPIQLQALCHSKGITRRDDRSEHSMPSHLVESFRNGKSIFGFEKSGNQSLERISPIMCIRVFNPNGNALVRASRLKRKNDESDELKVIAKPEWPGRATGQPADALEEAKSLIATLFAEVTGMSAGQLEGLLALSFGEILMSDQENDKYITVHTRYIRHFIDVKFVGTIPEELSMKLGFTEGQFQIIKNPETGEVDTYEWWSPGKCDEDLRLMGDTIKASKSTESQSVHDGELDFSFRQAHPWNPDLLEGVLRRHKVNTKPVREMRADLSKHLETGDYTLVHKLGDTSQSPIIALVREDGRTLFFPGKAGSLSKQSTA